MNSNSAVDQTRNLAQVFGDLAPLDMLGMGLVLVLILVGIWRGLWWQVIRLVGLILSVATARFLAPEVSDWILESTSELSPRVAHGCAWGAIFMLTLGAATILGMLGQRLLEAMKLGLANRAGGAFIGACTGIVVHLALLVALSQLAPEDFVSRHMSGTYSSQLLDQASTQWRVVLGADAADHVDRLIGDHLPRPKKRGAKQEAKLPKAPPATPDSDQHGPEAERFTSKPGVR